MQDATQIERQLHILSLLSDSKHGCTVEEIAKYLARVWIKVSKKTILRDIDFLSSTFPVREEIQGKTTYYVADKFNLKNISFTLNELIALYFTKEIMNSYLALETGINASLLVNKIIAMLPLINRTYIDSLSEYIKVRPVEVVKEKAISPGYLDIISNAIAFNKKLVIQYKAFNSIEETERCIDPYHLEIENGCYQLVAFCHLRNSLREFRVSRIKGIYASDETFIKPDGIYEAYKKTKFDKLSGEQKINIKLKFTGFAARYVNEYEFEKADKLISIGQDELLFEKGTTMSPEIVKWILGFGFEAEVLEPPELREQIANAIKQMNEKYLG